jgi:DnaJ-class molecular chaperone
MIHNKECSKCKGSGWIVHYCPKCKGSGREDVNKGREVMNLCYYCHGDGTIGNSKRCKNCSGKGYLDWIDQIRRPV